jgi:hypothetical protein
MTVTVCIMDIHIYCNTCHHTKVSQISKFETKRDIISGNYKSNKKTGDKNNKIKVKMNPNTSLLIDINSNNTMCNNKKGYV